MSQVECLVIKHYHEKQAAETEIFGASVTFATSVGSVWLIQSRSVVLAVVDTIFKVLEKRTLPKFGFLRKKKLWNKKLTNTGRRNLMATNCHSLWRQSLWILFRPVTTLFRQSLEWNLKVVFFPCHSQNFCERWSFNSENFKCSRNQWKNFLIKM